MALGPHFPSLWVFAWRMGRIFLSLMQNLPVMSSADQDLMRNWANTRGKCVRQRTVRQETTKYKAGTLPLNMYQTAVYRGERLEFAPVESVEQPEFSKEEGREGAPTSRDPGDDQLSEYDDDSSDNDSDDFAMEEDGANRDMQNEELGFLFASRRTQSGRVVKTTNKALLWTKFFKMKRYVTCV